MAAPVNFSGLSTGLQTDKLIDAILQQEGQPLDRIQARQDSNKKRIQALQGMQAAFRSLASSLGSLSRTSFDARTVVSSDANNTYVSASASGAAPGVYDVRVKTLATRAQLQTTGTFTTVNDSLGGTADGSGNYIYTLTDTDGTTKTITLSAANNTLGGIRDAINASGAKVNATLVQTAASGGAYSLVLQAKDTGQGTAGATFNITGSTNNLIQVGDTLAGGTNSSAAANAEFYLNGLLLTRKSNTVTDAVDGVSFTLRAADQTKTTTITVAQDKAAITAAFQDSLKKFNDLLKGFKDASAQGAPLFNDPSTRSLLSQLKAAFSGSPEGISASSTYTTLSQVGLKTQRDGTFALDASVFEKALDTDAAGVKRLLAFSGVSTSGNVSVFAGSSKTTTGAVAFDITSYASGGAVSGTITVGASTYNLTGTNGTLTGASGTPLEGLVLAVTGTGSGTLTLSRGLGQAVEDLATRITAAGNGDIAKSISNLNESNYRLGRQIDDGQARLDRRRLALKAEFGKLETAVGQLQSLGQSLGGLR